jgi:hypothetical protein
LSEAGDVEVAGCTITVFHERTVANLVVTPASADVLEVVLDDKLRQLGGRVERFAVSSGSQVIPRQGEQNGSFTFWVRATKSRDPAERPLGGGAGAAGPGEGGEEEVEGAGEEGEDAVAGLAQQQREDGEVQGGEGEEEGPADESPPAGRRRGAVGARAADRPGGCHHRSAWHPPLNLG